MRGFRESKGEGEKKCQCVPDPLLFPHPPHPLTAVPKDLRSKSSSSFACMLVASPPAVPSPAMACFFLAAAEKEGARLLFMLPTAMGAEGERERVLVGVEGRKGDV